MNPLQQIPANVRTWLYWSGYGVGVVSQGTTVVWGAIAAASPEVDMPLGLVIVSSVLAFLQTQLNLVSGVNVHPDGSSVVVEAPAEVTVTTEPLAAEEQLVGDWHVEPEPGVHRADVGENVQGPELEEKYYRPGGPVGP